MYAVAPGTQTKHPVLSGNSLEVLSDAFVLIERYVRVVQVRARGPLVEQLRAVMPDDYDGDSLWGARIVIDGESPEHLVLVEGQDTEAVESGLCVVHVSWGGAS